jgi:signal transduction histidine kinase
MRIRSRLILLVAAVLVPAVVGAGIGLWYVYTEQQALQRESMHETARALALALDGEMARRESILQTLGGSTSLKRRELPRFHAHASSVANRLGVAIILSDLEGRQLVNTRIPFGRPLPDMLAAERENRARLGNEVTVVSDVYLPPAGLGPHSFAIQVPVRSDGEVVGFLTMGSFARQLQQLLAAQRLPEGWHATIVDRRGVVAARSVEAEKFVGQPVRGTLGGRLASQAEGMSEGRSLAGVASTVFFSRAPSSGWSFLLTVPQAALHGPAVRATLALGAVSLLLLVLGLALAALVARRITRPVQELREAAQRLGDNEPVWPQATGTLELDAVSEAMAGASERLRGATAELERRVAQAVSGYEESQRALVQAQKLDALGQLTGGIAHDFNNVLQTLTAALQVMRRGGAAPGQLDLLARCERAVARGSELARQLMVFGRVQEVRSETLDTRARLAEARHLFGGALRADMRLELELAADLWPVTVDPAQLELALLNLVINARDAMPAGGRVVLAARNETLDEGEAGLAAGDYVALRIADTGEGMSEQVRARALDPFFTTKGVGKGSGMGLPQAYGFARQSSGTLTLESRRGAGTTVTIYLPRASEAAAQAASPAPLQRVPTGSGRVLIVEDDEYVRETMSEALRAAGFHIEAVATADAALERIEAGERFDAILTDVVMPGRMSGIELAQEVRRRHARVGIVVATGYSDRAVHLPGVRALAKPYDVHQAVDALNAAIGGAAKAA